MKENLLHVLAAVALFAVLGCAEQVAEPGSQIGWSMAMGFFAFVFTRAIVAAARCDR